MRFIMLVAKIYNEETSEDLKSIDKRLKLVTNPAERSKIFREWQTKNKERAPIKRWQKYGDGADREAAPTMRQGAMQRGLSRLHGQTKVRRGTDGDREFLLYRTLDNAREEYRLVRGTKFKVPNTKTSWSPKLELAKAEAKIMRELVVGVWIPEPLIINIPKMYGNLEGLGKNKWAHEWEVIIKGSQEQLLDIGYKFDEFFEPEYSKLDEEEEETDWDWKSLFPSA